MLLMVGPDGWLQQLQYVLRNTEVVGGHGDAIYQENAESAVDPEVTKMADNSRRMVTTIRQRQLRYLGYVLRGKSW